MLISGHLHHPHFLFPFLYCRKVFQQVQYRSRTKSQLQRKQSWLLKSSIHMLHQCNLRRGRLCRHKGLRKLAGLFIGEDMKRFSSNPCYLEGKLCRILHQNRLRIGCDHRRATDHHHYNGSIQFYLHMLNLGIACDHFGLDNKSAHCKLW
jgi:hypothetical protein